MPEVWQPFVGMAPYYGATAANLKFDLHGYIRMCLQVPEIHVVFFNYITNFARLENDKNFPIMQIIVKRSMELRGVFRYNATETFTILPSFNWFSRIGAVSHAGAAADPYQ